MRTPDRLAIFGWLLAASGNCGAQTAEARAAPPPGVVDIASCVSSQALRFESGDLNAILDDADRQQVSAAMTPRVGRKHFPQTLPLAPREVVLTFDDGPWPGQDAPTR